MKDLALRYGLNPNQTPSKIYAKSGDLPFEILNGAPGYINMLAALNGWQLVREISAQTGLASAASFKHVSPAGVGTEIPLTDSLKKAYHIAPDYPLSKIATAYARARGADRMSSYGDFISLSETCDTSTAKLISREVSDGIIAPGYTDEALEILSKKKKGNYLIIKIDKDYTPSDDLEQRDVFGIILEQKRNDSVITPDILKNIPTANRNLTEDAIRDLMISLITLKYTQSNSVCYAWNGQTVGVGAGQQSRIHCVRLAGDKSDIWFLRQHPKILALPFKDTAKLVDRDNTIDTLLGNDPSVVLNEWENLFTEKPQILTEIEKNEWIASMKGISLGSDAFFPFGDNIERAQKSGVSYVAQAGGSVRDDHVIDTCDKYGICMSMIGTRLFHH